MTATSLELSITVIAASGAALMKTVPGAVPAPWPRVAGAVTDSVAVSLSFTTSTPVPFAKPLALAVNVTLRLPLSSVSSAAIVTRKVALVCPARMVTVAGAVAEDTFEFPRLTTRSAVDAQVAVTVAVTGASPSVALAATLSASWLAALNATASELMPFATTANEYVPAGNPAGSVNSVVTGVLPVITPVLLQL